MLRHVFQLSQNIGSMGLIKCQDLGVGPDLLLAFLSDVCHILFSQHCGHLVSTSAYASRCVKSFVCIYSGFDNMETFHFGDVSCLPPVVHLDKKVSIPCFP